MKKGFFSAPAIFALLVGFIFVFPACSKGGRFNFAESGTVNLKYTCADEEKNFDTALNAGQSDRFIRSLNKISYDEVDGRDINFPAPYDSLTIKINNGSLVLDNAAYIINHGGYFYFNGRLCSSEEKFGFLEPYLAEHCPDIIPTRISFGVQYVKAGIDAEENYQIIRSAGELNDYIAAETQNSNFPDIVLFQDEVVDKYSDGYFENSFIIVFMKAVSSGSFGFKVSNVYVSRNRLFIDYEIIRPSDPGADVTCDMAYWYSFAEISNEYNAVNSVWI